MINVFFLLFCGDGIRLIVSMIAFVVKTCDEIELITSNTQFVHMHNNAQVCFLPHVDNFRYMW